MKHTGMINCSGVFNNNFLVNNNNVSMLPHI